MKEIRTTNGEVCKIGIEVHQNGEIELISSIEEIGGSLRFRSMELAAEYLYDHVDCKFLNESGYMMPSETSLIEYAYPIVQ